MRPLPGSKAAESGETTEQAFLDSRQGDSFSSCKRYARSAALRSESHPKTSGSTKGFPRRMRERASTFRRRRSVLTADSGEESLGGTNITTTRESAAVVKSLWSQYTPKIAPSPSSAIAAGGETVGIHSNMDFYTIPTEASSSSLPSSPAESHSLR